MTESPAAGSWSPDVLGPCFQQRTLPLPDDDEGAVVATLVRYAPESPEPLRPARAILFLHGWSDYFYQRHVAEFWHSLGAAFYALDLRKYGRSLRSHQTPGYVDDLAVYDGDLDAALAAVHEDLGQHAAVMVMAHSTGGLIAALWANRHPGRLRGLILNSPWLELTGSSPLRTVSAPAIRQLARVQPKAPIPLIDPGYYARTLTDRDDATWTINPSWRPTPSFPVRPGWLRAIIAGHARVAGGLRIDTPILVACAGRSLFAPRWTEEMRRADIVLDADLLARRAPRLGDVVTVVRVPDGMHDLTVSLEPARSRFFAEVTRWTGAYGWSRPRP